MTLRYVPYVGGAGPSDEQAEQNTRFLAQAVDGEVVKGDIAGYGTDEAHAEVWAKVGERYATYDRWGFYLHGHESAEAFDQATLEQAIEFLKGGK